MHSLGVALVAARASLAAARLSTDAAGPIRDVLASRHGRVVAARASRWSAAATTRGEQY